VTDTNFVDAHSVNGSATALGGISAIALNSGSIVADSALTLVGSSTLTTRVDASTVGV
jgi:hypothetical protein